MLKYATWFAALLMVTSSSPLLSRTPSCVYDSCGTSNDKVKDIRVKTIPDPPQLDKEVEIFISGILTEQVDKGTAQFKTFFGTSEVSVITYDLCNVAPAWNVTCPIHPGPVNFLRAPNGHIRPIHQGVYRAVLNITDENHNVLCCVKGDCIV